MRPEPVEYSGPNLKAIRKKRNLSQEELGKPAGFSRQAVAKYEKGLESPTADTLAIWATLLNVKWEIPPGKAKKNSPLARA